MRDRERPTLSPEDALDHILSTVDVLDAERVPLLDAAERVLAEAVAADRDIPPADNSAMDGYAVRGEDMTGESVRLRVVGDIAAGHEPAVRVGSGEAARIMTGASIPKGADTVVRFEDTRVDGARVEILDPPRPGKNVRAAGEDVKKGQVVLKPGTVLRPQEIGMMAALGHMEVTVHRRPRVAILATGDEVVPPETTPGPSQIRNANSYTVAAQVRRYGGVPLLLGVARDREALVRQGLREALAQEADFIVTSGGVSVGDFDLVKQILTAEGRMHFWWINQKPGRPMAFGEIEGVPLIGLPGNPVSTMVSAELYVRPSLLKMQGFRDWSRPTVTARLAEPVGPKDERRHYVRVQLEETEDGYEAHLTGDQGSGILNSLVLADGLAVIPEYSEGLPEGAEVAVILLE